MIRSAGIFQKSGFTERFSMRWRAGAAEYIKQASRIAEFFEKRYKY
jgi:hypothetical protein